MSTTTDNLPEYTVTVATCGDPQPVIDELTEWLDEQTAPKILTWVLVRSEDGSHPEFVEPEEGEDEPEPAEADPDPAEGEDDPHEPAEGETEQGGSDA